MAVPGGGPEVAAGGDGHARLLQQLRVANQMVLHSIRHFGIDAERYRSVGGLLGSFVQGDYDLAMPVPPRTVLDLGANIGADAEGLPESDLVLLWGTNTLTSNPHLWPFVAAARKKGARVIAIDPRVTETVRYADWHLRPYPGTDGRGVFRVSQSKTQRFTFDGTAGGLRSDHVYAIFLDREGVIWFGTDRGVCRFDAQAPRLKALRPKCSMPAGRNAAPGCCRRATSRSVHPRLPPPPAPLFQLLSASRALCAP